MEQVFVTRKRTAPPRVIDAILQSGWLWLIARICMVFVFAASGTAKLIDFDGGVAEMAAAGLSPAWLFNILVVATLLISAVLVLLDRAVWLASGALSVFLVLTILVVHSFWNMEGPKAQISMFFVLEHITVIGGLMAVAIASRLRHLIREAGA
ncbi:DoxX family protein [Thalassospira australica]|uniref:DoxX family protein n=1 Tax=Thalassospira australica TaxID=1528106 RepID=UPI00385046C0